jgi:hypothetical protein
MGKGDGDGQVEGEVDGEGDEEGDREEDGALQSLKKPRLLIPNLPLLP